MSSKPILDPSGQGQLPVPVSTPSSSQEPPLSLLERIQLYWKDDLYSTEIHMSIPFVWIFVICAWILSYILMAFFFVLGSQTVEVYDLLTRQYVMKTVYPFSWGYFCLPGLFGLFAMIIVYLWDKDTRLYQKDQLSGKSHVELYVKFMAGLVECLDKARKTRTKPMAPMAERRARIHSLIRSEVIGIDIPDKAIVDFVKNAGVKDDGLKNAFNLMFDDKLRAFKTIDAETIIAGKAFYTYRFNFLPDRPGYKPKSILYKISDIDEGNPPRECAKPWIIYPMPLSKAMGNLQTIFNKFGQNLPVADFDRWAIQHLTVIRSNQLVFMCTDCEGIRSEMLWKPSMADLARQVLAILSAEASSKETQLAADQQIIESKNNEIKQAQQALVADTPNRFAAILSKGESDRNDGKWRMAVTKDEKPIVLTVMLVMLGIVVLMFLLILFGGR